jgi:hypothetical protein
MEASGTAMTSDIDMAGGDGVPGWKLSFAAGFVPLIAGLNFLITDLYNVANADAPWWTGLGSLRFSFGGVAAAGVDAGPFVNLLGSVGPVNVIGAAVLAIAVARYGLREGRKWAWAVLAFDLVWVGFHDAFAAFRFYLASGQPAFVFPFTFVTLMFLGLAKSRAAVFQSQSKLEGSAKPAKA